MDYALALTHEAPCWLEGDRVPQQTELVRPTHRHFVRLGNAHQALAIFDAELVPTVFDAWHNVPGMSVL